MQRVAEPLSRMGAIIRGGNGGNFTPITVEGGMLKAIYYMNHIGSAQVKSAILLAGLFAKGITEIEEPCLSRDHTERLLQ